MTYGPSKSHGPRSFKDIGSMHFAGGSCWPPFDPQIMHSMMNKWHNYMPYDLDETKTDYIVVMPLPGLEVKDIEVSVRGKDQGITFERCYQRS